MSFHSALERASVEPRPSPVHRDRQVRGWSQHSGLARRIRGSCRNHGTQRQTETRRTTDAHHTGTQEGTNAQTLWPASRMWRRSASRARIWHPHSIIDAGSMGALPDPTTILFASTPTHGQTLISCAAHPSPPCQAADPSPRAQSHPCRGRWAPSVVARQASACHLWSRGVRVHVRR